MIKQNVGSQVYIKKSSSLYNDKLNNMPLVIQEHVIKNKNLKAKLNNGFIISFGELTEKPCSKMICGNCIYHKI